MANWMEILGWFGFCPDAESEPVPEPTFGGVPLSKLREIAEDTPCGLGVSIDQCGFLIFHYRANNGHTTREAQITIDEFGKLVVCSDRCYNGQQYFAAQKFVKNANELLLF